MIQLLLRRLLLLMSLTLPFNGLAQEPPAPQGTSTNRPVAVTLGTGVEYDSNVAVLELDASTNASDRALLLDFGVGYDKPQGPLDVQAGYNFSQSLHDEYDTFDVGIHRGSTTLSYDFGRVDAGAMLQYAYAELDRSEFLTLSQFSPYLSTLLGRRLFLRFAYLDSDKDFAGNPARNARADAVTADAYIFLDGLRTYLVVSYRYDDEDARDDQFDYTGDRFRLQLSKQLQAGERTLTFKVSGRTESRDYEFVTPSLGTRRADDRYELEASIDVPLGERVTAQLVYKRADNDSNLPSVNFAENVLSIGFSASL